MVHGGAEYMGRKTTALSPVGRQWQHAARAEPN